MLILVQCLPCLVQIQVASAAMWICHSNIFGLKMMNQNGAQKEYELSRKSIEMIEDDKLFNTPIETQNGYLIFCLWMSGGKHKLAHPYKHSHPLATHEDHMQNHLLNPNHR